MVGPTNKQITPIFGEWSTCVQRLHLVITRTLLHHCFAIFLRNRIFSETLLAGVLDPEYEAGMINFRRTHRGTLLGMTRFRDGLDDMPILGYGRATIRHDLTAAFHATLSGHTLNYLTRGTHWGTEQRQQISWSPSPADQGRSGNEAVIVLNIFEFWGLSLGFTVVFKYIF